MKHSISWIPFVTVLRRECERFLRVPIQTLVSPWISALLYLLVFGRVIGGRIAEFEGFAYVDFVLPGILMMQVVMSAYGQSSTSLYFQRFTRAIEEMLVAPISYTQMILGYVTGSIVRALVVGAGVYVIALLFTDATMNHVGLFIFYFVIVSVIFALIGLLVGVWSEKFEHLSVLQTFVLTPLLYVGGIFNTIAMLPESLQFAARLNPMFHMVNGLRYSLIGFAEIPVWIGGVGLTISAALLFVIVFVVFKKGYKLRT